MEDAVRVDDIEQLADAEELGQDDVRDTVTGRVRHQQRHRGDDCRARAGRGRSVSHSGDLARAPQRDPRSGSRLEAGRTWNGQLEPPPDIKDVVAEAEEGRDQEGEEAREVGRERVVREREEDARGAGVLLRDRGGGRSIESRKGGQGWGEERGGKKRGEVGEGGKEGEEEDVDRGGDDPGRFRTVGGSSRQF